MAYTKTIVIKNRLDAPLNYIMNKEKTIDNEIDYVSRNKATEDMKYVTCVNCDGFDPKESMKRTKEMFGTADCKRIAYHLIQSFKPGEGDADTVHEIGLKWANELFGDRFEFVLTTHLDKEYLHNHLIVNSTSFVDGKQFTNTKADQRRREEVSDRLCRKYGYSVIEKRNGKHQSTNIPNYIRNDIRKEMDEVAKTAVTWTRFINNMRMIGYDFEEVDGIDCVYSPAYDQPIPFNSLGKNYTYEELVNKILGGGIHPKITYEPLSNLEKHKRTLSHLQKLYYRWCYDLGILPHYTVKKKLSKEARKDLRKLDQISKEVELISRHNLQTLEDVSSFKEGIQSQIDTFVTERKSYYSKAQRENNLVEKEKLKQKAKEITPKIKELRQTKRLLEDLEIRTTNLRLKYQEEIPVPEKKEKEKQLQ